MPPVRPLRLWLALRLVLPGIVPLAVVATLVLVLLLPQLRADIDIHHQALARAVAGQVEAHLQGAARELRSVAANLGNRSDYPPSFWSASLDAHAGSGEVFAAIYIVDVDDSVVAVGLPETQRSQRTDLLQLDVSAWTSLQAARQHRQATWSETFLSTVSGRLAVTLAVPVDGRLLVGEIAVDQLSKFIARIPAESGMLTMIVDRRGQVIAHSQIELSGQQLSVGNLPIVGDALRGRFATGSFAWGGSSYVGTPVSIAQLDWIVVVAQPRQQALQPFLSTLWALAAGAVVAVLVAIAVAVLLSRALARGLDRYAAQAHAIADGDYGQRWETFRIREIDALTGDLDRMSLAIRQRERELAASEARYRSLISNLPVVLFQFDEQGGFTLFEGRGLERLGITAGEVVGRSIFDLCSDSSAIGAHARRAVDGEAVRFTTRFGKLLFEVYFNPLPDRDGALQVTGVAVDITEREQATSSLRASHTLLDAISHTQSLYITGADPQTIFDGMLAALLAMTESAYGFIGEVLREADGTPYLKTQAITNIAWDEASRGFYAANAPAGMEFRKLDTLFGAVLTSAQSVIANDPANDPRGGGIPPGHPALNAFMGLPLFRGRELVGMVGVANRQRGYDEEMAARLQPFLHTCASVTQAIRETQQRRLVAEALRESEARLRTAIESIPFDFFLIDASGRYLLQNSASRRLWGDVVGKHPEDIATHAAQLEIWQGNNRRALAGEIVAEETRLLVGDDERFVHNIIAPVTDDGEIRGIVGLNIDITERKRMEEGLLDSEERFRLFMHHFPGLAYIKDAEGRTLFANQGFRSYLGLSPDEMIGKTDGELFAAEFAEQISLDDQRILASGQYEEREEFYAGRHWSTLKFPLNRPGHAPLLGGLTLDISQRRLAEDALRAANRQLRMLSDCNQALIRTSDESELLQTVCAITVEEGGYRMAWVGYKEADERRTVRPAAHAGHEDGYLEGIDLSWADGERGQGPMGTAIRTGRPCLVRNIAADPRLASRQTEASRRGYVAVCALPLTVSNSVLGALAVYSSTADSFATAEIDLLSELANDLAFGIAALRTKVERERATRALEESEFFLRKSQDVGDLGSYYFDVRTGTWISSEKLDQLFGIDDSFPKTTSGWIELVHPDQREEVLRHLTERVLGQHNKFDMEYRIRRHDDGQERWMHGLGELEFDDRGMPRMMIGTIQDITRTKQADRALHESEERLQQAIRVSQLGIFDHDHRSDRIFWSPEQRLIHGWGADEAVTLPAFLASVHADDRPMIAAAVQRAHDPAGDGVYDVTCRIIRHGEVRWVVTRSQTIFTGEGTSRRPLRTVGADLDITDRKRTEAELERYRQQLEELVAERTAELRQAMDHLVQSEKLAALGHLVAGVAHELNTPLGNARVVASSLSADLSALTLAVDGGAVRRSHLDAFLRRGREGLDLLERNAARAADLIGQFKEVAVDQTSVRRRRFQLRQTIEELLLTLSPQFRHTGHRIELEIAPDIELDSYPGPLEQVLANLISNSLTHAFGDARAGCIRIQAEATSPNLLVLRYRDDGSGIPGSAINRIFEPFFTSRLGQGGSGLGLYIVYNLVTGLLAGSIRVESSPGAGTSFTLTLPLTAPVRPTAT
ncbi:MAG: PAS domain S-box protein [Candidatus Accumulibacter sp.]|nr:PAS domain S-box protein [Candidatus Accumulibacter conexus]